jgi:hypothetical protein
MVHDIQNGEKIYLEMIKLMGISVRLEYFYRGDESWAHSVTRFSQRYTKERIFDKIPSRKSPYTTFMVFLDPSFNPDHVQYKDFIGEEVLVFDTAPDTLETLTIPAQNYLKLTDKPDRDLHLIRKNLPFPEIWNHSSFKEIILVYRYPGPTEFYASLK